MDVGTTRRTDPDHRDEPSQGPATTGSASATPPATRRMWPLVIVGTVVLAMIVIAVAFASNDDAPSTAAPLELTAGGEDALASCIAFSPTELGKVAEIAFAGTVTTVEGSRVVLDVDTWFRGGDASAVALSAPQGLEALIGGIPFVVGNEYLVSAAGGAVNYCGFSGPATSEYRAAFDEAFAAG